MKRYYRTAQQVSTLNEMLLAYFNESVITPRLPSYERKIEEINEHFKLVDGKLAVQHHKIFRKIQVQFWRFSIYWLTGQKFRECVPEHFAC